MSPVASIFRWPLILSLVLSGQLMVFSLGMNLAPIEPASIAYWILHGILMSSTGIVMGLLGWSLIKSTVQELVKGRMTIETMFTLSAVGALVVSLRSSFMGVGPIFYEVVTIVLCIYTIGKQIGHYAKNQVLNQIETLREELRWGWMKIGDHFSWENLTNVSIGSHIKIETGKMIPVDGVILQGNAFVSEATITGEPFPRACEAGDQVFAGSTPIDGELILKVTQPYGKRLIDGVLQTIEAADCLPSRLQVRSDRLMQFFVPFVVALSLATFLLWFFKEGAGEGLLNSMSVLLVACPCALGLATPIAVWSALWNLAQKGLLIKNGTALDKIAQSTVWVFDKTGTLSYGDVSLKEWIWHSNQIAPEVLQAACKTLQKDINHPIAKAFLAYEDPTVAHDIEILSREWHPGVGIEGRVKLGDEIGILKIGRAHNPEAHQAIDIEWNEKLLATVTWEETFREDVTQVFEDLKSRGCEIFILTGDSSTKLEAIAQVNLLKGQTPLDKIHFIRDLKARGEKIVFVGDGVNDAAAMSEADIAIAMGDGASLTQTVAEVLLKSQKLEPLTRAHRIALSVQKGIDSNMLLSLGYNLLGIGFAATGYLHPVVAALIMTASSTLVCIRAIKSAG